MRYYTPSLEEFHPGFIYQQKIHEEWKDMVVAGVQDRNLHNLRSDIVNNNVRVKYLDTTDLDVCNWVQSKELKYSFLFKGHGTNGSMVVNHDSNGFIQNISIFEPQQHSCVFRGTCKNINELRRIMKQTGFEIYYA